MGSKSRPVERQVGIFFGTAHNQIRRTAAASRPHRSGTTRHRYIGRGASPRCPTCIPGSARDPRAEVGDPPASLSTDGAAAPTIKFDGRLGDTSPPKRNDAL